jgi:hypothetical protein
LGEEMTKRKNLTGKKTAVAPTASKLKTLTAALALSTVLVGCAKDLPEKEPDSFATDVRSMSSVQNAEIIIETVAADTTTLPMRAGHVGLEEGAVSGVSALSSSQFFKTKIVSSNDNQYNDFVKDLVINAKGIGKRFKVTFKLTHDFLVGYIENVDKKDSGLNNRYLPSTASEYTKIPLFQYSVSTYGIKENIKNDLNEETRNIKFTETNRSVAKFFRLSPVAENRKMTGLLGLDVEEAQEIYNRERLESTLWTVKRARNILNRRDVFRKSKQDSYKFKDGDLLRARQTDDGTLTFFRAIHKSELTDVENEIINQSGNQYKIIKCDEDVAKAVKIALEACFLRAEFSQTINNVRFVYDRDQEDGNLLARVKIDSSNVKPEDTEFIQIATDSRPEEIVTTSSDVTGKTDLKISKFKGKEFMFRRVLEDSPNVFNYSFAGQAGSKFFNVEIVKFIFDDNSVKVVKSKPNLGKTGTTEVDFETIMSFPATYIKAVRYSDAGEKLPALKYETTNNDDPQAIAQVDFTRNNKRRLYSAIDFYSLENCFAGQDSLEKKVEDVRQVVDGEDDYLNYTLVTAYNATPSRGWDCAGVFSDFDAMPTLKFKERISFKRYKGTDEKPVRELPYELQKKFNFGLFTGFKDVPTGYTEQTNDVGTTEHLPMIFDIRAGKQIEYVLAGIPSNKYDSKGKLVRKLTDVELDLRNKIISSSKKVIEDMNEGFRKAFKGTEFEGRSDVIVLKIEKDDSMPAGVANYQGLEVMEKGHIGDLSRNYIYWIEKGTASSIIGLGGPHHNPRNGFVEAASVYLYGGNMKSSVDWMVKTAKAERKFVKDMQVPKDWTIVEEAKPATEEPAQTADVDNAATAPAQAPAEAPAQSSEEVENVEGKLALGAVRLHQHNANLRSGFSISLGDKTPEKMPLNDYVSLRSSGFKRNLETLMNDYVNGDQKFKPTLAESIGQIKHTRLEHKDLIQRMNTIQQSVFNNAVQDRDAVLAKAIYGENSKEYKRAQNEAALRTRLEVDEKGRGNPICVHRKSSFVLSQLAQNYDILEKAKTDIGKNDVLIDIWMPTLAHEIGHNLGLRHNFIGSFDKKHWDFPSEVKGSKRTSSSVMDYTIDDHANYDGLGPYDVYALRAAYTGYVELEKLTTAPMKTMTSRNGKTVNVKSYVAMDLNTEEATAHLQGLVEEIKALQNDQSAAALVQQLAGEFEQKVASFQQTGTLKLYGNLVKIQDVITAIGKENRNTITKDDIKSFGIKKIGFCSDEDAGESPQCNRHDYGSTFTEIVNHEIFEYRKLYNYIYFPGMAKEWSSQAPFGWMMRKFTKLRQLNEEFFFQYFNNAPGADADARDEYEFNAMVQDIAGGIIKSMDFFRSIIATPEVPAGVLPTTNPDDRFIPAIVEDEVAAPVPGLPPMKQKKLIKVETKWSDSLRFESGEYRVSVKGNEIDKAAAIMALTAERSWTRRYLRESLRMPYTLIEKYLFRIDPENSIVLKTLEEVLMDEVTPKSLVGDKLYELDKSMFTADVTEIVRDYAAYGAMLFLNISTYEPSFNPSRSFRVEKVKKEELEEIVIGQDADGKNVTVLEPHVKLDDKGWHYRPFASDSFNSANMIEKGSILSEIASGSLKATLENWSELQPNVNDFVKGVPAVEEYSEEEVTKAKTLIAELMKEGKSNELVAPYQILVGQFRKLLEVGTEEQKATATLELRDIQQNMALNMLAPLFAMSFNELGIGVNVAQIRDYANQQIAPIIASAEACIAEKGLCTADQKTIMQGLNPQLVDRFISDTAKRSLNDLAHAETTVDDQGNTQVLIVNPLISMFMATVPMEYLMPRQMEAGETLEVAEAKDAEHASKLNKYRPTVNVDSVFSRVLANTQQLSELFKIFSPTDAE